MLRGSVYFFFTMVTRGHLTFYRPGLLLRPAPVTMEIFLWPASPSAYTTKRFHLLLSHDVFLIPHATSFSPSISSSTKSPAWPCCFVPPRFSSLQSALFVFKNFSESHADLCVRMKMELFFDFKLSATSASQTRKKNGASAIKFHILCVCWREITRGWYFNFMVN